MRMISKSGARLDTGMLSLHAALIRVDPTEPSRDTVEKKRVANLRLATRGSALPGRSVGARLPVLVYGFLSLVVGDSAAALGGALGCIFDCVPNVAHDLLCLALDLLGSALGLSFCVSCPLANLTLSAACSLVDGALNFVAVHVSTSVGSVWKVRLQKTRTDVRVS